MNRIAIYLNKYIDGAVYSSPNILNKYSTDRSILKYFPRVVAIPANSKDICRIVTFSKQLATKGMHLPITIRGSGMGKNGGCLGSGIIISTENLNKIQEIDVNQRLVRVQAGATIGEINKALKLHGLFLPFLANEKETIGGAIAQNILASNNTKPCHIDSFIEEIEIVLSDGNIYNFTKLNRWTYRKKIRQENFEGDIYRKILPNFNKDKRSIIKNICGSCGTLGVITEVILRCEPIFVQPDYFIISCAKEELFKKIELLQRLHFTDIFFTESKILQDTIGKSSKEFSYLSESSFLIIANAKDDSRRERSRKFKKLAKTLPKKQKILRINKDNLREFYNIRSAINLMQNDDDKAHYLPVVDGVKIPKEKQLEFIKAVQDMISSQNLKTVITEQADYGVFNLRAQLDVSESSGRKKLIKFMRSYLKIVYDCGGNPSAASSEGKFLSIFIKNLRDKSELEQLSIQKTIFDPNKIFNPYTLEDADPANILRHFRNSYDDGISPNN